MLDAGSPILGFVCASGFLKGSTTQQKDHWTRFAHWVSSYYSHGDLSTRNVDNLEFEVPNINKESIAASLPPEELSALTDHEAASRSEIYFFKSQNVLFNQTHKVLCDPETRLLWPKLDFWLLYCDSSPGLAIHSAWEIEKLVKANESLPVQVLAVEDAHHLVSGIVDMYRLY